MEELRTQKGALQFHARQAGGSWTQPLKQMVEQLGDEDVLQYVGVAPTVALSTAPCCSADSDPERFQNLQRLLRLTIELLSQRSFSMALHSETFPDMFAVLFHPDAGAADAGLQRIKEVWTSIFQAERLVYGDVAAERPAAAAQPAKLRKLRGLLADVAFHGWTVNREFVAELQSCGWDRHDESVAYVAWGLFARVSNTKRFQEDVFNNLRRKEEEHARNKRMNRWSKYYHAYRSPRLPSDSTVESDDDIKMMTVKESDWFCELPAPLHRTGDGIFVAIGHKPKAPVNIADLAAMARKGNPAWKVSGPQANWRSAAATRLLVHDAPNFWNNIEMAWCGATQIF